MVIENFINEWFGQEQEEQCFTLKDNVIVGKRPKHVETDGISKLILDSFNKSPDFVCQILVESGEKITFAEMKDHSIRCALWLKKQGIGKDDIIAIATPIQKDDYVPCLATFFVGATFNPWYHELTPALAQYFFNLMQPKIMFACEQSIDLLAQAAKDVGHDCQFVVYGRHTSFLSLDDLMAQQSQAEVDGFRHVEPEEPKKQVGAIYFSSGTTGTQKGTMISYNTVVHNRNDYMWMREHRNLLWYSSLSWITGTNFLMLCIRKRATRILHANFDAEETSKVVEKYKVNWTFMTPTMLTQLCKNKAFSRYDYSSMKVLYVGGSKPTKSILEEAQKALPYTLVSNSFGMTELGGVAAIQSKSRKRMDSIGFLIEGIKLKVIDAKTGRLLGPNQQGEICIKLDDIMLGYLNNPEQTKEMIDDEGWVHTGDLGFFDEDGEISIVNRIKEVIITQNHHVSPSQIEDILVRHPEVLEAAVVPVSHHIDVERPLAFVIKTPDAKITAEELKELPTSFNKYFRLSGGVIFVDELPYTSTGKKCLKVLKEMAKAYAQ